MSSYKIVFEDYSDKVIAAMKNKAIEGLHEAAGEVTEQTARNTPVDTGQLKNSWRYVVDSNKLEAQIGTPLEYGIYVEFGTGAYAEGGKGRKTEWKYKDAKGQWHITAGRKPVRMLRNAFLTKKPTVQRIIESKFKVLK